MNQQQRKYALARVSEIKTVKIERLKKELTKPAVRLNKEQRLSAFRKGEFTIKKEATEISNYTYVVDIISFNAESEEKFDKEKFHKQSLLIEKQANQVSDEIMLGDAQEAMRLLEKFEA